ncbi:MAG: nodulation protein NfeD [Candidatus Omnitrophica bacterium]|nr:nodulation protein NfeD [Candidatus Omnitrophota bacterium]MCM8810346.1 nodulation protein NfeD [Candidatus Omnitrophota bacterium]
MRKIKILFLILYVLIFKNSVKCGEVYLLNIEGAIGPMTYYQVKNAISLAKKNKFDFILITIDTPGGLLSSTRKIVQEILSSDIPIVGFVYPSGAQCASAGTFIALSCHILAMAPATNIGAAHPVTLTGGEQNSKIEEKIVNDTVSFIKTIAKYRGRNEKWAEKAVRESISSTEEEALKEKVIDLKAKDINDLLEKIDGKIIKINDKEIVLYTKNVKIKEAKLEFKDRILKFISDPNIAYLLLILGIWGIILEFSHPGFGIPGIVGTIALILAFFGLHTLPINMAGLILIILSFIFFIIEAITPTFGIFITSGIITFILGSLMLFKKTSEIKVPNISIILVSILTGGFIWFIIWFSLKTKRRKVITGKEGLIGEEGKTITELNPEGMVFVHGEHWKGKSIEGKIEKDKKIKVIDVKGLVLIVEEIKYEKEQI